MRCWIKTTSLLKTPWLKTNWNRLCNMRQQVPATNTCKKDTCLLPVKISILFCNTILAFNIQMNEHLPSPDILLIVLIAVGGIFVCLKQLRRWQGRILSLRFSVTGDEGRLQISVQMQVPVFRREICCTSKNSLTWLTTAIVLTCILNGRTIRKILLLQGKPAGSSMTSVSRASRN